MYVTFSVRTLSNVQDNFTDMSDFQIYIYTYKYKDADKAAANYIAITTVVMKRIGGIPKFKNYGNL